MLQFDPPNKLVVRGDGEDVVIWQNLPTPTTFVVVLYGQDTLPDTFQVDENTFEATFSPGGYVITLSATGYEPSTFRILAW